MSSRPNNPWIAGQPVNFRAWRGSRIRLADALARRWVAAALSASRPAVSLIDVGQLRPRVSGIAKIESDIANNAVTPTHAS
jgi:hypothetical protein